MTRIGVRIVSLGFVLLFLHPGRALLTEQRATTQGRPQNPNQKLTKASTPLNDSRAINAPAPKSETASLSDEAAALTEVILQFLTNNLPSVSSNIPGQKRSHEKEGGIEAACGVVLAGGVLPRERSTPEMAEILSGVVAAACRALQRLDGFKDRFMSDVAPNLSWNDLNSFPAICETHIPDSPSAEGMGLAKGLALLYSLLQRRSVLMTDAVLEQIPFTSRGFVCAGGSFSGDFHSMANDLVALLDHLHAGVSATGEGVDEGVTEELSRKVFAFPLTSEGGCLLDYCALRGAETALRDTVDFALSQM
ncbi:uncharacterized protein LOC122244855 [Penaeus japonicus]|uniref:uncharacterized protein LOC122244855 n=1 Tax=Penaeus japonicus TaxID=27405 RepID=UPI001C714C0F|nr:uncharacterized protein LOC122244855 [Penaeus japonicus]